LLVKHVLAAAIRETTVRMLAGITSGVMTTQALACSSVLGVGVDRANGGPEHLNLRPSVNTNTQELTPARRPALVVTPELTATVAADEQLADVT
jgi:hypothetical protein